MRAERRLEVDTLSASLLYKRANVMCLPSLLRSACQKED